METFEKSLEHAPALVAIIIVVFAFLKFIKFMRLSDDKRTEIFVEAIRQINQENMEARHESRRVIEENTKAAALNTAAMAEMTGVMRVFTART